MKMEKTVDNLKFEAFIVPNRLMDWDDMPQYLKDRVYSENERLGIHTDACTYVQVWVLSKELGIDNATDHGFSKEVCVILGLDYNERHYYAPGWIPLSRIIEFKEGDILKTVSANGTTIEIKFSQIPYRYRRFGKIEEVLKELSK